MIASEFLVSSCGIVLKKKGALYKFIGYLDHNGNLIKGGNGKWFTKTKTIESMKWEVFKVSKKKINNYEDYVAMVAKQDELNKELIHALLLSVKVLRVGSREQRKSQASELESILFKWGLN